MTVAMKDNTVYAVEPPLYYFDVAVLEHFTYPMGTVIYVPFDPFTFEIPREKRDYIVREINGYRVVYSPNVWEVFMRYYAKVEEKNGKKYLVAYKIPILFVDYHTPIGAFWHGTDKPPDMPIDAQYKTWKSGYMMARVKVDNPGPYFAPATYYLATGWWWVKYEARLIDMPASLLSEDRMIIKYYYKKIPGIAYKIPGVKNIAEYIYEHKLKGDALKRIESTLATFGLQIDYSRTYKTDKGKVVKGPYVEETKDGFVVYMPVMKVGSYGPEVPAWLVAVVIVCLTIIIASIVAYKIVVVGNKPYVEPLNATKEAMDNYLKCRQLCDKEYPNDKKGRENCYKQCADVYSKTIEEIEKLRQLLEKHEQEQHHMFFWPSVGLGDIGKAIAVAIGVAVIGTLLLRRR